MTTNSNHAPSFRLIRLYRKTSQKGSTYFAGRLGGAKVTLLKARDTADDGGEIWDLLVAEAPQKTQDAREPAGPSQPRAGRQRPPAAKPGAAA